jgi:hypothetical protein
VSVAALNRTRETIEWMPVVSDPVGSACRVGRRERGDLRRSPMIDVAILEVKRVSSWRYILGSMLTPQGLSEGLSSVAELRNFAGADAGTMPAPL